MKTCILAVAMVALAAGGAEAARSELQAAAERLAAQPDIPGAAVIRAECGSVRLALSGTARQGEASRLSAESRFNLGSNAKSMLATAAAILVERGLISWETSIAESEVFGEMAEDHPHRDVSLRELFSHTGGIATFHTGAALRTVQVGGPVEAHHLRFAEQALAAPPAGPRGDYAYSNAGPVIAALMLERAAGADWLTLMETELFAPWGLDAGLGEPAPDGPEQPFGHYLSGEGLEVYSSNEPEIDPFLQPSGYIAITPQSYGAYLERHVCGLQGLAAPGLSAAGLAFLHETVSDTPSALGWARQDVQGQVQSFHIGSTGAHYAFALLNDRRAVAVLVNSGSPDAAAAAQSTLLQLGEGGSAGDR
jgi:CubicO group peptidase (beta-lactamase class C family)